MQSSNELSQHTIINIHPDTEVGTVTLKVSSLAKSVKFYTELIGLEVFNMREGRATLGAGHRPIIELQEVPGAARLIRNATGLYHVAILFPDRVSLARKIKQLTRINYQFGMSDHLVSEAFYLDDPDGNGLELYWDRPSSEWVWIDGRVQIATNPIDFKSFFGEIALDDPLLDEPKAPAGTKLGHMHLRVGDVEEARKFYHELLGFDIVIEFPGALFVSAGGYHHHIGMNTWESLNANPPVEPSAGLQEFSIVLVDEHERNQLLTRVESYLAVDHDGVDPVICDPSQNRIRLVLRESLVSK